jgi:AmmeMemoRadiSam system protein A
MIYPRSTLAQDVAQNAISAATCDSRFDPVSFAELGELTIEVSVLTTPSRLLATGPEAILAALRPGVHGVILHNAGRRSTFLPQVWKELPEKEAFLDHLCRKGGMPRGAWYAPSTEIFLYEADVYGPIAAGDATSLEHGRTDA